MNFNKLFQHKSHVQRLWWTVVVFMSIVFNSSVRAEHYTDACRSINGRLGTCVPLASCPLFYGWLKVRPLIKENLRLLVKYTCYLDISNPKVCCPNDNLYASQEEEDIAIRLATPIRREIDPTLHSPNKLLFPETSHSLHSSSPAAATSVGKDKFHLPLQEAATLSSSVVEAFDSNHDRTPLSFPTERYNLQPPNRSRNKEVIAVSRKDLRYHPNFRLIPKLHECSNARKLDSLIGAFGAYPWIALVGVKRRRSLDFDHVCSGAIINNRYILTSAHCFDHAKPRYIRVGEYNLDTLIDQGSEYLPQSIREDYKIEKFTIHPEYKAATGVNDIALIRVEKPMALNTTFVKSACLPFVREYGIEDRLDVGGVSDLIGKPAWVAGWSRHSWDGLYSTGSESSILQEGIAEFTSHERCRQDYPKLSPFSSRNQFCVGGKGRRNSCAPDSGSPLMYPIKVPSKVEGFVEAKFFMLGVLSHGPTGSVCQIVNGGDDDVEEIEAASRSLPSSVYTRVSKYLSWILDNIHE